MNPVTLVLWTVITFGAVLLAALIATAPAALRDES